MAILNALSCRLQRLRYKDFQLVARPAVVDVKNDLQPQKSIRGGLHEVESVKDFSTAMEERGVLHWWKRAMGYVA